MSLQAMSYPGSAEGAFFAICAELGQARVEQGRKFWTLDDWRGWVAAGREAYGDSPSALFGQLRLVEAMLNSDVTAEQISIEMSRRKDRIEAEDRRQSEIQVRADAENKDRARHAAIAEEREKAIIRETARLEAKDIVGAGSGGKRSW